jgi:hypothetical protein
MKEILPILLLLLCPLMMIFMMRGMHGRGESHGHGEDTERDQASVSRRRDERAALEKRVRELETRLDYFEEDGHAADSTPKSA